jgi:hypothetical protein
LGNAFYKNSIRLQEIISSNAQFSYELLDFFPTRKECLKELKHIYKCQSSEGLSNIDYYNLYDICYILCREYDDSDYTQYRQDKAREFVGVIKRYPNELPLLLEAFCGV